MKEKLENLLWLLLKVGSVFYITYVVILYCIYLYGHLVK